MLVINNPMSKLLTRPGQLKLGKVELDKDVNKKKKSAGVATTGEIWPLRTRSVHLSVCTLLPSSSITVSRRADLNCDG